MSAGLQQEEARFKKEIQQLELDLKIVEKDESEAKMDAEKGDELVQVNQMLVQEVDVMKQQMVQMASYVQAMEQRNTEMANQMQGLVALIKTGGSLEMPVMDSPQMVHRPRKTDLCESHPAEERERSRSPAKRSAEDANLEVAEILDLEKQEVKEILATIPEKYREQMVAIMKAEPSNYQSVQEVWNLAVAFQTQLAAQVALPSDGGIPPTVKAASTGTAMLPFRVDTRRKRLTGAFDNEMD